MSEYGMITEQGDLGLGFDPLTEQEEKQILENSREEEEKENDGK